ncbi:MAG: hypothetical protein K1X28_10830 [Parachlamydiales bacterium]|nr:hypothetical protein [Parachlamydiales bacterium]
MPFSIAEKNSIDFAAALDTALKADSEENIQRVHEFAERAINYINPNKLTHHDFLSIYKMDSLRKKAKNLEPSYLKLFKIMTQNGKENGDTLAKDAQSHMDRHETGKCLDCHYLQRALAARSS